jgi:two-component system, OmpR family, sensor histidine kinase VicK
LPLNSLAERTEVLYGTDKVISEELQFFFKTKRQIDTCMDRTRPSLAIGMEAIKNSFVDAKSRGVKLRYLTEITDTNISYCKGLMSIVDEVRHLDGIKGNFMVSEMEYLAPATSHEEAKLASLIIYSSVREIVEHQQYVFYVKDCKCGILQPENPEQRWEIGSVPDTDGKAEIITDRYFPQKVSE